LALPVSPAIVERIEDRFEQLLSTVYVLPVMEGSETDKLEGAVGSTGCGEGSAWVVKVTSLDRTEPPFKRPRAWYVVPGVKPLMRQVVVYGLAFIRLQTRLVPYPAVGPHST
jgi:hypothetical protein